VSVLKDLTVVEDSKEKEDTEDLPVIEEDEEDPEQVSISSKELTTKSIFSRNT